jgi:hypothetical protein
MRGLAEEFFDTMTGVADEAGVGSGSGDFFLRGKLIF